VITSKLRPILCGTGNRKGNQKNCSLHCEIILHWT
jgi:hypothetical protein